MVFDLVALGAGPGGYSAALQAAGHGLSVALVEKGEVGGCCLNRGCVPAKAWISAAETVDHAGHMASLASEPFDYSVDFHKMAQRQRRIVSQFRKSLTAIIRKKGIKIFAGAGRFVGKNRIAVERDGSSEEIDFKHAVIAVGTEPARLFDVDPSLALDNTTVFDLPALPRSFLIVGAGAIGCEFASAMARLGSKVTLAEAEPRILPAEDREISATLARELKKQKVDIVTGVRIKSMKPGGEGVVAVFEDGRELTAGKALFSVGRRFPTGSLGLPEAGVETGKRGEIVVDERLRTSAPSIFAVGDVAGRSLLAYTAVREGRFVADYIAGEKSELANTPVPNAIFTIPEIGSVGLREEEAPASARKGTFLFRSLARAHSTGEIAGLVKVIADGETDRLLGVHIIGSRATDLVHTASVAIARNMTARELGDLLFAHPTFSEAILEAVEDVHGKSIHK